MFHEDFGESVLTNRRLRVCPLIGQQMDTCCQLGLVAQLVERRGSNPEVLGSNPAGVKDVSLILVLHSNFFFKGLWSEEIIEGSIAYFSVLIIVSLVENSAFCVSDY